MATNQFKKSVLLTGRKNVARFSNTLVSILPFVGLIFVFLFFLIATGGAILAPSNLANLVEQCFTLVFLSLGATFIYAAGNMDFSIGNILGVAEMVTAFLMIDGRFPLVFIILVAVSLSVAMECVVGAVTVFLRVPSVIASMCIINICTGIMQKALNNVRIYTPYDHYAWLNGTAIRAFSIIAIIVFALLIFNKTKLGRQLKAAGGNSVAALQSGVAVSRTIMIGFVVSGICIGIAAVFGIARAGTVSAATGSNLGLNVLVAIVLGGFPLTGGAKSRVIGAVVGALTVSLLSNGIAIMGIDSSIAWFVRGILFLIIVAISYDKSKGDLVS